MKYLNALLQEAEKISHPLQKRTDKTDRRGEEKSLHTYPSELTKLTEGPLSVLSVPSPKGIEYFKEEQVVSPWPCPHCGKEATIEAVEPSLDGERMLTYWRCDACPAAGVKPEPIQAPSVKPAPSPLKTRYRQTADAVLSDCLTINATWLANHQPELWQRMTLIDRQLERLEQRNAEPGECNAVIERLVQTVKKARALYEQERQQGAVVQ